MREDPAAFTELVAGDLYDDGEDVWYVVERRGFILIDLCLTDPSPPYLERWNCLRARTDKRWNFHATGRGGN